MSEGVVLTFPGMEPPDPGPRSCDQCVHFLSGVAGEFCRALMEDIFSVHEAEDCPEYEAI